MEDFALKSLEFYLLIFARGAGLFVQAPVFASPHVSREIKIGLMGTMALLFFFLLPYTPPSFPPLDIISLLLALLRELFIGIVMGYVSFLPFAALQNTGELIDTQMGISTAMAFDPRLGMANLTRRFMFYLTMVIFIVVNGHHVLIKALYFSFKMIPPGTWKFAVNDNLYHFLTIHVNDLFFMALKYGLPVLGAIFIGQVSLGVIARVAPQTNVFILSMPVNFLLGVTFLGLSIPIIIHVFKEGPLNWQTYGMVLDTLIRILAGK